jgi:hypothetical protein
VTVEIEMIVDRGMDRREFLKIPGWRRCRSHSSPPGTTEVGRSLPPLTGRSVSSTLQKLQGSLAIPPFCGKNFEHFTFVINGTPEIMCLTVDAHKHFVQVPALAGIRMVLDTVLPNFRGEHRGKPVPPETHRLVANIDAALEKKIFDLPQ